MLYVVDSLLILRIILSLIACLETYAASVSSGLITIVFLLLSTRTFFIFDFSFTITEASIALYWMMSFLEIPYFTNSFFGIIHGMRSFCANGTQSLITASACGESEKVTC